MNTIYLDHAATTAMEPEAVDAMLPYFRQYYGNPSAAYRMATESKRVLRKARQTIADTLQILPEEVFFTSGGTESDNWAVLGTAVILKRDTLLPVGWSILQFWKPADI